MLQERLDNRPPSIAITFPDGITDYLILSYFYAEENRPKDCYFSDNLEHDSGACVAMTGCIGTYDVELTIMSDHATESGMYKWTKDGKAEEI